MPNISINKWSFKLVNWNVVWNTNFKLFQNKILFYLVVWIHSIETEISSFHSILFCSEYSS